MTGDFYRKIKKPRWWKDRANGIARRPQLLIVILAGVLLGTYILFNNKGLVTRVRLEVERKDVAEKVQRAEKETKQLQAQLKALEGDKKTIEKIARERHGMAREGETVYRVKKD